MIRRRLPPVLLICLWLALIGLALLIDLRVADWVAGAHVYDKKSRLIYLIKLPGYFPFTIGIALLLILVHPRKWRAAAPLLLSGPLVGAVYLVLKWMVGRRRPVIVIEPFRFHPFAGGLHGLIHAEKGLCFPSGHAALSFATATCLAVALPRWAILFFVAAAVVAAERVLENAHYVSDAVAGAGVGVLCALLALRLCRQWFGEETATPDLAVRTSANDS